MTSGESVDDIIRAVARVVFFANLFFFHEFFSLNLQIWVSHPSVLLRPPPPPPRSGSSQHDGLQVTATLRATESLVHHSEW